MSYNIAMTVDVNPKSQQYTGKKLKEIRERNNMSQEEVAKVTDISVIKS